MENNLPRQRNIKIGKALCGLSLLLIIIFALLRSFFTGLFLALPIFSCGLILIFKRENVLLYCLWTIFFFADIYIRYGTGITWRLIFLTKNFLPQWNYSRLIVAWIEFIIFILLTIITIVKEKNKPIILNNKKKVFYILGWILFFVLLVPFDFNDLSIFANIYYIFGDWLRVFLYIFLITWSLRLRSHKKS